MNSFSSMTVRTLTVLLVVAALLLSATILPGLFSSGAENQAASITTQETTADRGLPNYDVRTEKSAAAASALERFRIEVGRDYLSVDMLRGKIAAGESAIRERNKDVVVEYSDRLGSAEVISPSVWKDDPEMLTPPSGGDRPTVLRNFL